MVGVKNYLKLNIVLPLYASLSIFLTPHISPSSYNNRINTNSSIEQLEKNSEEMKSMIAYLEDRVVNVRKSRIISAIPRSSRYLDSLFVYSNNPEEISAIVHNESDWTPYAVSQAGAAGLTMMMPSTAYELGLSPIYRLEDFEENENKYSKGEITREERDNFRKSYSEELISMNTKEKIDARFNPYESMKGGIKYSDKIKKEYKNPLISYAAYNAGPEKVNEWIRTGWNGEINEIQYPETKKFVENVASSLKKIRS